MNQSSYFQVQNGHFVRDLELGFNYKLISPLSYERAQKTDWKIWVKCSDWSNKDSTPININHIPPSIFLLALTNGLSRSLALFIPTDMPYQKFFERLALEFAACGIPDVTKSSLVTPAELNDDTFDLDYLNQTGVIKSAMKWNNYWLRNDRIWIIDQKCLCSIQGIVQSASQFWSLVRD